MDCSRATVPCGEANIKPVTPPAIPTPGGPGAVDTTRRAPHNPARTRILSMRGSRSGECPERQRGRTVNPLAYAFVGSSPTSPTSQPARNQESEFRWKEVGWLWLITDL